ncbi:unnamed protein product [Orchesella dallaii]|uniref:DUF38 domain-containing protein n=1 Tax=Orchesella dallaii TaxID=48710 RepID=A0ABP1RCD8_9HEXA
MSASYKKLKLNSEVGDTKEFSDLPLVANFNEVKDDETLDARYLTDDVRKVATPLLEEEIPQSVLLQCRQISKGWNHELDEQQASHPFHYHLEYIVNLDVLPITKTTNTFLTLEDIEKFMTEMKNHPGNPFPGRNIEITTPESLGSTREHKILCKNYWRSAIQLLNLFGKHVRHLSIDFRAVKLGMENVAILRNILLQVPNLQVLKILMFEAVADDDLINSFQGQYPFPPLEQLESLVMYDVNEHVMHTVLRYCCVAAKLKRLALPSYNNYNDGGSSFPKVITSFLNLETLVGDFTLEDLEILSTAEQKPPLKHLLMGMDGNIEDVEYFKLEAFSDTLVYFDLQCKIIVPRRLLGVFNLPNLKTLIFRRYEGSLDPFLNFKSLDHLEIDEYEPIELDSGWYVVDIHKMEEKIYKSNIWNLIPSLNTFDFGVEMYERKVFEKVLENN